MPPLTPENQAHFLENWIESVPLITDLPPNEADAVNAIIEAGMIQYRGEGWPFKLHETAPEAPMAQFKLMMREADGVNQDPALYDRIVLPGARSFEHVWCSKVLPGILGYPNAGTPIAESMARTVKKEFGVDLVVASQQKHEYPDGTRELGNISAELPSGHQLFAIDDTTTGGQTKIEGFNRVKQSGFSYSGLFIVVERDPLGSAFVRQHTEKFARPSLHWLTIVKHAARVLDLPRDAVQKEIDYSLKLFNWKVRNERLDELPTDSTYLFNLWSS